MEVQDIVTRSKSLPFPILVTSDLEMDQVSFRTDNSSRPTLRFYTIRSGKRFRIKEFFMDWFYTGFPKSLMKTLVETYGPIVSRTSGDITYFYGTNYKGNDSITFHKAGTTVEIECQEGADSSAFGEIVSDLRFPPQIMDEYRNHGFKERSFLAHHRTGTWWEDQRIGRMDWSDVEPESRIRFPGTDLMGVSAGIYSGSDGSSLRTVIYSDESFDRAIWVEILDERSDMPHGKYDFRRGGSLFNIEENSIFYLDPNGPGACQKGSDSYIVTMAFSPGFSLNTVRNAEMDLAGVLSNSLEIIGEV